MKDILYTNNLTIKPNLDCPNTTNLSMIVVCKGDEQIRERAVGTKCLIVWPHVVGSTRVSNEVTRAWCPAGAERMYAGCRSWCDIGATRIVRFTTSCRSIR